MTEAARQNRWPQNENGTVNPQMDVRPGGSRADSVGSGGDIPMDKNGNQAIQSQRETEASSN